jgi:hypothetical protein
LGPDEPLWDDVVADMETEDVASQTRQVVHFRGSHRGVQLPGNPRSLAVMNPAESLLISKAMSATRQEIRGHE